MTDADPAAVLDRLAVRVRDLYCTAVRGHAGRRGEASSYGSRPAPRWDGGEDEMGRVHRPVWPRLAEFCLAQKIDPEGYFAFRFREAGTAPPPTPLQLISPDGAARYLKAGDHRSAVIQARLVSEAQAANALYARLWARTRTLGWTKPQVETAVVLDQGVSMSPLFRMCLAAQMGRPDLQAYVYDRAIEQYLTAADHYDRVWGPTVIPWWFRDAARAVADLALAAAGRSLARRQAAARPIDFDDDN